MDSLHGRLQLAAFVLTLLASAAYPPDIYAQNANGSFVEFGSSYGEAFRPRTMPSATATFAVGSGRNLFRLEFGQTSLGNYAVGIGSYWAAEYDGPVSASRLQDFSLKYERDLYRFAKGRGAVYGGAGLEYFKSRFTVEGVCVSLFCSFNGPISPQPIPLGEGNRTFGFGVDAGIRMTLWNGLGIRAGMEASPIPATNASPGLYNPAPTGSELTRVTFGLFYRYHWE